MSRAPPPLLKAVPVIRVDIDLPMHGSSAYLGVWNSFKDARNAVVNAYHSVVNGIPTDVSDYTRQVEKQLNDMKATLHQETDPQQRHILETRIQLFETALAHLLSSLQEWDARESNGHGYMPVAPSPVPMLPPPGPMPAQPQMPGPPGYAPPYGYMPMQPPMPGQQQIPTAVVVPQ